MSGPPRNSGSGLPMPREIVVFAIVGLAAFAVHFTVVSLLVPAGLPPLVANVVAFFSAFSVSFFGHNRWTFPAPGIERPAALKRFFVVATLGFAGNETLYWVLLTFTALSYQIALLIVLTIVATSTMLFSKYWAFAHEQA
jgi:putative flippase GtrA